MTEQHLKTRKEFKPIRDKYLASHPFCERCGAIAKEVHHIKPLIYGGTNEDDNLSSLCNTCHKEVDYYEDPFVEKYGELAPFEDMHNSFLRSPSLRVIASVMLTDYKNDDVIEVQDMLYFLHCAELVLNGQPNQFGKSYTDA